MTTDHQRDPLRGSGYRAVRPLGQGGMGIVYEAEHLYLGTRWAVKVLLEDLSRDASLDDRFRVEAQTLALVQSEHLIRVSNFGRLEDGRAFYVMDLLEGRSLSDELAARGALPLGESIAITRQILLGLAAAHRAGVIHRDIKPDNVFLCGPGRTPPSVKILDFGVAKVLGGNAAGPAPIAVPTREGVVVGTPRYLAPEQALGLAQSITARADIYAVGIVLYSLVAGRGPFADVKGILAILQAQTTTDPRPPSLVSPQPIPPALDAAILRALARSPEARFPTADAFIEELDQIAAGLEAAALPSFPARADTLPPKTTELATTGGLAKGRPEFVATKQAGSGQENRREPLAANAAAPKRRASGLLADAPYVLLLTIAVALVATLSFVGLFWMTGRWR